MKEEFLHSIWKYILFDTQQLQTTFGEKVAIISTGIHNKNQGPDFLHAKIKIGQELMVGHVEIHLTNEDWYRHKHEHDTMYDNTILHIVYQPTEEIYTLNSSKNSIPILVLKPYIAPDTLNNIEHIVASKEKIPCHTIYKPIEDIAIASFKSRLLVERLDHKSAWMFQLLKQNTMNIEETFYQVMLYGFGLKVNSDIFLQIAKTTPQHILAKHSDDLFQLEALLLGQANLLNTTDDYCLKLRNEYQYLSKVYSLRAIDTKPLFSKMLPPSFPTRRLAEFAAFIYGQSHLFSKMITLSTLKEFKPFFNVNVSDYWTYRYNFGDKIQSKSTHISTEFVNKIILNVIIPFIYCIDTFQNKPNSRAIEMYDYLSSETNAITKLMQQSLNLKNKTSYDSQAIIEWHNSYCSQKRCQECIIGIDLFKIK